MHFLVGLVGKVDVPEKPDTVGVQHLKRKSGGQDAPRRVNPFGTSAGTSVQKKVTIEKKSDDYGTGHTKHLGF